MRNQISVAVLLGALSALPFHACTCDGGLPEGAPCTVASECTGGLVCDPATGTCGSLGCTANLECGAGAACVNAACVDNTAGGPCDADINCVGGEHCRGDTCFPQGSVGDTCDTTEACAVPLVCNPADNTCAEQVACTTDTDCGNAAFCNVDGQCAPAGEETPCAADANCQSGDRCLGVVCIPEECQGEAFNADPIQANMLIVFDRSGSMTEELNPQDGSKLDVAKAAIKALVDAHADEIRFGFAVFPNSLTACDGTEASCELGTVAVDIADNNATAIDNFIDAMGTCSGTPAGDILHLVQSYAPLQDTTRNNFVILMTDGASNCGLDPVPEVATLLGQNPTVKTFVIGFGAGVDATQLTNMSAEGGVPRAGDPNYYQADDAASLDAIFQDIAQQVLACDYILDNAGDDPDALLVFFNGQPVPRDDTHVTGWDFDPTSHHLTFSGNACIALQTGSVTDLSIAFGCPGGPPPADEPDAGVPDAGQPDCASAGDACQVDDDCCGGFLCNQSTHQCIFLGG